VNKKALLIAVITALGGVALAQMYLSRLEDEVTGGVRIPVLIAAKDLKPGTILRDSLLGVRSVPQAYVGERNIYARDAKKVVGIRVSTLVKANEPVLWSDIATLSQPGRDLSSSIQEGKRALSLSGRSSTFDGLLRPGDRVDILFTPSTGTDTSTLLQNILVLAVGGDIQQEDNDSNKKIFMGRKSVTVSVSMEEGQLLTQAERQGTLKLVLRNPEDIELLEGIDKTSRTDLVEQAIEVQKRSYVRSQKPATPQQKAIDHVR
jgi:Flp pilus assembly protein CpaB